MKSLLKSFLIMAVTLLVYCMVSAQQIGTPINKQDSVKVEPVKMDSLFKGLQKDLELRRGLLLKDAKKDSAVSK